MSIVDTVSEWVDSAADAAARFSDSVGSWFSRLPNTGSGVLTVLKAGNAAIDAAEKVGQGAPLAEAVAQSANTYKAGGDMGETMNEAGTAIADAGRAVESVAGGIVDAARSAVAAITEGPPLWVKFIIAGAVVVGVVYTLNGVMHHAQAA